MAAPSHVNARGSFLRPPQLELDIADCDIKSLNSARASLNTETAFPFSRIFQQTSPTTLCRKKNAGDRKA